MSKKEKRKRKTRRFDGKEKGRALELISKDPLLCIRGPIYGPSGYSRMTRNLIEGMHLAGKKFWLDAMPWVVQPTIEVTPKFKKMVSAHVLNPEEMRKTAALLCICLPTDLPSRPISPRTWVQTLFETTKIPENWLKVLKSSAGIGQNIPAIQGIIIPSRGNFESFVEAPQHKTVVPLAIDYELFHPDGDKAELPHSSDFNILASYHQSPRKNPELLIRIINEFDSDTTVYLKTFGIGMSSMERDQIAMSLKDKTHAAKCKVVLLYDIISDEDQAEIYRAVDLVLNVAHGEGWDYPRVEAYSCGTPALGGLFIGPQDYTIPEFQMINHRLVPCPDLPPFFNSTAKWAELDLIEVMQAIDAVRTNRKGYKDLALKQRDKLMEITGDLAVMAERVWKTMM